MTPAPGRIAQALSYRMDRKGITIKWTKNSRKMKGTEESPGRGFCAGAFLHQQTRTIGINPGTCTNAHVRLRRKHTECPVPSFVHF
jgi:hypothetical protein